MILNTIAISGSRSLVDKDRIEYTLQYALDKHEITPENSIFITGVAKGIDTITASFLEDRGFTVIRIKTAYKYFQALYHRIPPKWRNKLFHAKDMNIIDNSDLLWTFWDGKSRGTKFTILYAKKRKIPIRHWVRSL